MSDQTIGCIWPVGDDWPYPIYPNVPIQTYTAPSVVIAAPPADCAGDVHVFPCAHCNKCRCGKATIEREGA
jgi:hypothetical protein